LSVQAQTYPHIKHLVSYDDDETGKYVTKYPAHVLESYRVEKKKNTQGQESFFPFNLYLNELIDQIAEDDCWIMFLDDDDVFTRNDSVAQMVQELETIDYDVNQLLMWQVQFPTRLVPKNIPKTTRAPSPGNVSCIGFMFHISQYHEHDDVRFQPRKGGDQVFVRSIWKHVTPCWVSPRANYVVPKELRIKFPRAPPGSSSNRVTLSKKNKNIKILKPNKKKNQTKSRSKSRKNLEDDDDPLPSNVWTRVNYERNRTIASGKCNDMRFDVVQNGEYKMFFQDNKRDTSSSEMPARPQKDLENDDISSDDTESYSPVNRLNSRLLQDGSASDSPSPSASDSDSDSDSESEQVSDDRNYYYDSQSKSDEDEYEGDSEPESEPEPEPEPEPTPQRQPRRQRQRKSPQPQRKSPPPQSQSPPPQSPQPYEMVNEIMHRMYTIQSQMQTMLIERMHVLEPQNLKELIREVIKEEMPARPSPSPASHQMVAPPRKKVVRFAKVRPTPEEEEEDDEEEYDREPELNSEDRQLNQLLEGYAETEMVEEEEEEEEDEQKQEERAVLRAFQEYLSVIFILNLGGKADELQYKFEQLGFDPGMIQIVDGNAKKSFYENMLDLARLCRKKKLKRVAIFQDGLILHRNFTEELVELYEQMVELKKWKMIVLSAAQNVVTSNVEFDPDYYRSLYSDLERAKLKTDQQVLRHWKGYGTREKRYGGRGVCRPDHLTGVSGVLLSSQIYPDLDKLKKAKLRMGQFMMKSYPKQIYATSPLLGLNRMNRMIRMRNKHNIYLYEEA